MAVPALKKNNLSLGVFFDTYPRLIPVIWILSAIVVFGVGVKIGDILYQMDSPNKSEAEIAYDEQAWKTKSAKERMAQEELENKFLLDRAITEKEVAQKQIEVAQMYAQSVKIKSEADALAIQVVSEAEIKANSGLNETLTSDLMEYIHWKISKESKNQEKNELENEE